VKLYNYEERKLLDARRREADRIMDTKHDWNICETCEGRGVVLVRCDKCGGEGIFHNIEPGNK
jgi:DnaJ-class molecular chaperone